MFPEGLEATDLREAALLSFVGTFSKTGKYPTEQFTDILWSNGDVICVDPSVDMSFRSFVYTGALVLGFFGLVLLCFVSACSGAKIENSLEDNFLKDSLSSEATVGNGCCEQLAFLLTQNFFPYKGFLSRELVLAAVTFGYCCCADIQDRRVWDSLLDCFPLCCVSKR